MSKNDTTSTTQGTSYPDWMMDSQHNLHDRTREYFDKAMAGGGSPVAGLTANQTRAGQMIGDLAGNPGRNYADTIMGAGQVSPDEINAQMSPFLDTVGRQTLNAMGRERSNRDAEIGARSANSISFGGSGPALERAQLNRGFGEQVSQTISGLMAQGYDRATAMAMANANNELASATAANGAETDAFNRRQQATNGLLTYGSLEQAQNQTEADRMRTLLGWYSGMVPGVAGTSTTVAPDNSPSIFQQLLGAGLAVGGAATTGGGSLLGDWLS